MFVFSSFDSFHPDTEILRIRRKQIILGKKLTDLQDLMLFSRNSGTFQTFSEFLHRTVAVILFQHLPHRDRQLEIAFSRRIKDHGISTVPARLDYLYILP